jgi:hypothetical protein
MHIQAGMVVMGVGGLWRKVGSCSFLDSSGRDIKHCSNTRFLSAGMDRSIVSSRLAGVPSYKSRVKKLMIILLSFRGREASVLAPYDNAAAWIRYG